MFIFIAVIYHTLIIHSTTDGHLGYFQFGVIKKSTILYLCFGKHMYAFMVKIFLEVDYLSHGLLPILTELLMKKDKDGNKHL
jgi:hypothetical protein